MQVTNGKSHVNFVYTSKLNGDGGHRDGIYIIISNLKFLAGVNFLHTSHGHHFYSEHEFVS